MTPFYNSWATSTHNKVPCLKCHNYPPLKALAGQLSFFAGTYNPRPLTDIPDRNCLQPGCHDKRLIQPVVSFKFNNVNINFNHKPHFMGLPRGIKLHCRSCHSNIVQGTHAQVTMNVCFLCHFKDATSGQALDGCALCHSALQKQIMYKGKIFSHDKALKAGYSCNRCHIEVTRGDGITPKDKCYFCHVEKTEMYNDVSFVHNKHVTERQVDCLWCHPKIEHGEIKLNPVFQAQ
jgi:hypothetical protein